MVILSITYRKLQEISSQFFFRVRADNRKMWANEYMICYCLPMTSLITPEVGKSRILAPLHWHEKRGKSCIPTLKNQCAKYLEVANYILLSLYSFPDWLFEEAEADCVRQTTSVDELNDELNNLHTGTVNSSKRLIGYKSSFYGKKRKHIFVFFWRSQKKWIKFATIYGGIKLYGFNDYHQGSGIIFMKK